MKNILAILVLTLLVATTGCKKSSSSGGPTIKYLRNDNNRSTFTSPNKLDTIVSAGIQGQWVIIVGTNLKNTIDVFFNGRRAAYLNVALNSDTTVITRIPTLTFSTLNPDSLNTLRVVTSTGEITVKFPIAVGSAPTFTGVSNEYAKANDSVIINGTNLNGLTRLNYAGSVITDFKEILTGREVRFKLPSSFNNTGKLSFSTVRGSINTYFNLNDPVTGMVCNFDDINIFDNTTAVISSDNSLFPNNRGNFCRTQFDNTTSKFTDPGRSINLIAANLLHVDSIANGNIANYAYKFEAFVKQPWSTGYWQIVLGTGTYSARFNPYTAGVPYTTTGWTTFTIPLNTFRTNNGAGTAATRLNQLFGTTGSIAHAWRFVEGTPVVANFDMAVDNIRIVRVR